MMKLMPFLLSGMLALAGLSVAQATDFQIFLVDRDGNGVPAAVVTLHPLDGQDPALAPNDTLEVVQRDLQFDPGLIVAPVGSQVSFPNADTTAHHVYSFSPTKQFDLRLIPGGRSESVLFDQAGSVAIGYNIHDDMVGFIHVVDTPWADRTGATGLVQIANVPDGRYTLRIWHERLNARDKTFETEITLGPERGLMEYELDLRRARQRGGRY